MVRTGMSSAESAVVKKLPVPTSMLPGWERSVMRSPESVPGRPPELYRATVDRSLIAASNLYLRLFTTQGRYETRL